VTDQPALPQLTPDLLLRAYATGVFPMAEGRTTTEIHWIDPLHRAHFPLDGFHVSQSLARHIRRTSPRVTVDRDFAGVVRACADRSETWINAEIFAAYTALHAMGHAHSLEVWQDDALIGGVYGVVLGGAFFGESMFSRATNGSKTALTYLVHRLRAGGFTLFDVQFLTPHLASLGAVEVPRSTYRKRLAEAINRKAAFAPDDYPLEPSSGFVLSGFAPSGAAPSGLPASGLGVAS
jgi:leucyl/phenylalanyl-tRNA--protein transferase